MKLLVIVSAISMVALSTPLTASAAEKPTPVVTDRITSRIVATCTESDGTVINGYGKPGDMKLSVSRPGVKPIVIALSIKQTNIRSISPGVGGKMIVIGAAAADDLSKTTIVDLKTGKVIDTFLGYSPAPSPNGHFVAFISPDSPHSAFGVRETVALYNLKQSPANNRPAGGSATKRSPVGTPVYPPGATAQSQNAAVSPAQVSGITSKFFWAPTSNKFLFSVRQHLSSKPPASSQNSAQASSKKVMLALVSVGAADGIPAVRALTAQTCVNVTDGCPDQLTKVYFGGAHLDATLVGTNGSTG